MSKRQACPWCTPQRLTCCSLYLIALTLVLVIVAIIVPPKLDQMVTDGVSSAVELSPQARDENRLSYRVWVDTTDPDVPPSYLAVYVFNVTNPAEVLVGGKPIMKEIGPYYYREYRKKLNVSFDTDDAGQGTVTYQDRQYYIYDADKTGPGLDPKRDMVCSINWIFQVLRGLLEYEGAIGADLFRLLFERKTDMERLFATITVDQHLWGSNLCITPKLCKRIPGVVRNITDDMVSTLPYDTIYTGSGPDGLLLRSYIRWRGQQYLRVPQINPLNVPTIAPWYTEEANRVHGSDGSHFIPGISEGERVTIWIPNLYRAGVVYNKDNAHVTYKGIDLLRFVSDGTLFANASVHPGSAAYGIVTTTGVLNVSRCSNNIPIAITKPHLLDVGAPVNNLTLGLHPDPEKHSTYIDVEPITGATMHAAKRTQININLSPVTIDWSVFGLDWDVETWFPNVNNMTLVPIIWIEEGGSLSDDQAHEFKTKIYFIRSLSHAIRLSGLICGLILILCSCIMIRTIAPRTRHVMQKHQVHAHDSINGDDVAVYQPLVM